jgi:hypothetical protein
MGHPRESAEQCWNFLSRTAGSPKHLKPYEQGSSLMGAQLSPWICLGFAQLARSPGSGGACECIKPQHHFAPGPNAGELCANRA